ncbi:siphovirus Gp157 family protein [Levilactobacillus namurensis]|uniref:siphovirus Gp157 family protein n=1 Tax=Levilactobacillus namurensis TaxID=380393 RepID=UPI0028B9E2A2|nr:siphovirus Gp157 family protein [Levilactobacillus namurensis]MDT7020122.1 siphovirus Gp157 family protein [Levilactobacillus namurensis]
MNLYQLEDNLYQVVRLAESADSKDQQAFDDTILSLKDGIADKAIGYGKVIKQLTSDEKQLSEKMKVDADRKASLASNIRRLKDALQQGLEAAGLDHVKDVDLAIWIQNNPASVNLTDEEKVPGDFVRTTTSLDKKSILAALKAGEEVPGAELQQKRSIRIR